MRKEYTALLCGGAVIAGALGGALIALSKLNVEHGKNSITITKKGKNGAVFDSSDHDKDDEDFEGLFDDIGEPFDDKDDKDFEELFDDIEESWGDSNAKTDEYKPKFPFGMHNNDENGIQL